MTSPKNTRIRVHDSLREQLKAGYQANAAENLRIALEWFPVEEASQKVDDALRVSVGLVEF